MPPLGMHRDHHPIRQGPLTGQVRQMGRAVHPDIKPGIHPVPDAGAGMVPASAGIGDVNWRGVCRCRGAGSRLWEQDAGGTAEKVWKVRCKLPGPDPAKT